MSRLISITKFLFKKYPILANSVTYGGLYLGAETSQQLINKKIKASPKQPLDTASLRKFGIYGVIVQGPVLTVWYKWLDKLYQGTAPKIILKKLLLDQFLLTPPLLAVFFIAMSVLEGKKDLFSECKSKFANSFATACLFWIPVQTLNFTLIPSSFRVIYVGVSAFAWVNILCFIKRQETF